MKHQDIETLPKVSQVKLDLIAAKALIDTPEKWCRGQTERNYNGHTERCSAGALIAINAANYRCGQNYFYLDACNVLLKSMPSNVSISCYNDSHTHAEVMAWWDRAIASV